MAISRDETVLAIVSAWEIAAGVAFVKLADLDAAELNAANTRNDEA